MSKSYRIIKRNFAEYSHIGIYPVLYNREGNPIGFDDNHNLREKETFIGLEREIQLINNAHNEPVLEHTREGLSESKVCPKCNTDVIYDTMDILGDGSEEKDFGKIVVACPDNKCGYMAIRQDYR